MFLPRAEDVVTIAPPPAGYVVDFEHPQRQATIQAYWCFGVGNLLAFVFLTQRFYTKLCLVKSIQLDDVFIILAWVTGLATQLLGVYTFLDGVGGVHYYEISVDQFNEFMLAVWIAAIIYTFTGSFAKMSLLVVYLRLSAQKSFRYCVVATMALITTYTVGLFFSFIFGCNLRGRNWDALKPDADTLESDSQCINLAPLYIATAVANTLTDVILFLLPIPLVLNLHLPKMQKVGLFVVFAIGSATVVTSVIRCAIIPEMLTNPDLTWAISYATMWIIIEANLLVICSTMPTLRHFFQHVAPGIMGYTDGTEDRTGQGSGDGSSTTTTTTTTLRRFFRGLASKIMSYADSFKGRTGPKSATAYTSGAGSSAQGLDFRPQGPYEKFEGGGGGRSSGENENPDKVQSPKPTHSFRRTFSLKRTQSLQRPRAPPPPPLLTGKYGNSTRAEATPATPSDPMWEARNKAYEEDRDVIIQTTSVRITFNNRDSVLVSLS